MSEYMHDLSNTITIAVLREAHHEVCECGGAEPGDGCAACCLWHKIAEYSENRDMVNTRAGMAEPADPKSCDCCGSLYCLKDESEPVVVCGDCWEERHVAFEQLKAMAERLADDEFVAALYKATVMVSCGLNRGRAKWEAAARQIRAYMGGKHE